MFCLLGLLPALPAVADTTPAAPSAAEAAPSPNATINLINLLVQRGILTKAQAAGLIKQANDEAAAAQRPAPAAAAAPSSTVVNGPAPAPAGTVRVTYVPQIVKDQLRDEIKQEVMNQAKQENWAAPNSVPLWVQHLHFYGDIRARYEGDFFPSGNDNTGSLPNFNAINTGSPFLVDPGKPAAHNFPPTLNVDQNRNRERIRARLGVDADLGDGFTTGLRIATGSDNSPVTTNQTLGQAGSGQGGDFSKYSIWLDRAYIQYQPIKDSVKSLVVDVGRFDNPFFSTSLIWDDDLGFDGVALKGTYKVRPNIEPFAVAGAFPIFNTDFNFASNQPSKFSSHDKYMIGAQIGSSWAINKEWGVKGGIAFYDFENIQGQVSDPCEVLSSADACDTDATRPSFAQNGNSYMPIRTVIPDFASGDPLDNNFQYYGLAEPFQELALTAQVDYSHYDPLHITLTGEFVQNIAFDSQQAELNAVNNRAGTSSPDIIGGFDGGNTGYFLQVQVGRPVLEKFGDWNVNLGYKYLESDAVVDGFTDSDFGLGGTNLKGFIVGGNLGITSKVSAGLRWLSADNIGGAPYKTDILQVDLNARF